MSGILKREWNYEHTIKACFIGYIVQAIVNNFAPLLFLVFQSSYDIPLSRITLLITFNFCIQLCVDFLSAGFIDKIGYRAAMILAHILSACGLISLAVLPEILPDPFIGLLLAVMIYAVGGGLLEVLVSPVVEACPTDNKETAMSLLHSFYCWGNVGVVLLSSLYFAAFGTEKWQILAVLWAIIPILNGIFFTKVPIYSLLEEGEKGMSLGDLAKSKTFWLIMLLMLCAGASEQAVSQWASTFAEAELHIPKTAGDLAGPMFFAILMGASRAFYGKYGEKINLDKFMRTSIISCIVSYLLISLSPFPALSFLGFGLCGFSVGILWPGSFSLASQIMPKGGTMLFAMLALAGDLGCSSGPTFVGMVSSATGGGLQKGILTAVIFPAAMLVGCGILTLAPARKRILNQIKDKNRRQ
ncbi:MAG TPA: MFS transporter [Candidatus Blautia faecigallinarum]|uniref:MFS transporter n=1 Tax=Candidatus Blautia faecigallinarum TaxID=2838488 RepID=A0A9D2IT56_9FIRM|nr:MFS transporter [Candidatus Blautia faecigallinarum]